MKRRQVLQGGAVAGGIALGAVSPVAAKQCKLDGRDNLAYDGPGTQIINLTRKVVNGVDTGHCEPTAWAEIDFNQHIQVFEEVDRFVAIVTWNGMFDAFDGGETPNDCTKTLDGDESGPFDGGVRMTFDGTFNPGTSQTEGHLGMVDQGCDGTVTGCDFSSTTGWMDDYFDSVADLTFPWWGFIYHGGRAGTWVNASTGDCGNID